MDPPTASDLKHPSGGNALTEQVLVERPGPSTRAPVERPPRTLRWLTPLVWLLVVAIVAAIIWQGQSTSDQPNGGILYSGTNNPHSWFVNMIFHPTSWQQKLVVMVVAVLIFVIVMGLILWLVDRPLVPNGTLVAGFLGPVVIALAGGLLYPAISTIIQSLRSFDAAGNPRGWVGLSNYTHYFTSSNVPLFVNTVLWIFLVPIFATAFGLVYAVLVDRTRYEAAAKALIFLPTAISMVAASVIWRFVYYQPSPEGSGQIGLLNGVVTAFGGTPQNWLIKYPVSSFALIIVMIWIQAGFAMTVLSAAIKAVPDDIIEAAKIDGASGMRLFRSITIPTIRPTLVVVLSTVAIASLKTFDIVNVMGNGLTKNDILASAFYSASASSQPGLAGALSVMIFILVSPVIVFNVRQMRKSEEIR
jgi:alpha-glucoside transport system permease protein